MHHQLYIQKHFTRLKLSVSFVHELYAILCMGFMWPSDTDFGIMKE